MPRMVPHSFFKSFGFSSSSLMHILIIKDGLEATKQIMEEAAETNQR